MKLAKALLTLFIFFSIQTSAQSADEIIDKSVKATGGDAWKNISALKANGIINANGTEINFEMIVAQNKGARQGISLAGLQGYNIITPTNGWNFFPWQGHIKAEAITPEEVKESQDNLDINPLVDYKAKGHTAEYMGTDEFEGTECYKVKLTQKSGKVVTYYIDPSNYLVIHTVTLTKANGVESEQTSDYSNYQKLPEGIMMPMQMGNVKIKKVEVNVPIDENLFKPTN